MHAHDKRSRSDAKDAKGAKDAEAKAARPAAPATGLTGLQGSVGNRTVLSIMRRERAREEHRHEAGCGHEDAPARSGPGPQGAVMRSAAEPEGAVTRSDVEAGIGTGGRPLDRATLTRKEEQFQADLSGVRVHTGTAAEQAAAAVQARAFTVDQDIVLGEHGKDPLTLDHELTHAVRNQQRRSVGHPTGGGFSMTHPHDSEEREAASNAARMRSGAPSAVRGTGPSAPRDTSAPVQRLTGPVQRMEGFETEMAKRVNDAAGGKLPGDTDLGTSRTEDFTVVSDSRTLDAGGSYSNVEFVSGAVQVVGTRATDGPDALDRIVDEMRRVRDDFYAAAEGTPLADATMRLTLQPAADGVTLSSEGYTEQAGQAGRGDGLYVQYTIGVPLAGIPPVFDSYRDDPGSVGQNALPRAMFRLNQAKPFAQRELELFDASATGKKRSRVDTDSLDGYLQLFFTQVAAVADYLATDEDSGQIKNLTIFLSRSPLAEAYALLDSDIQGYLKRNKKTIVDRLSAFQETTETEGETLEFRDRATRQMPGLDKVSLMTYAYSGLTGNPVISQQQVFGGMREITPHAVEGSTVVPMEIRAIGNYFKTWDELKAELRKIANWAQQGYTRDQEIHGPGGSRR
ncbi:DUF4157 domain-containing protein [Streptomyces sp. NPDC049813]|uniref:DUF4157 domain-containing protein n=1 Tax=Streptomyces sp. NPDC049813 TaxID=3365597 RepID=UPI0037BCD82E